MRCSFIRKFICMVVLVAFVVTGIVAPTHAQSMASLVAPEGMVPLSTPFNPFVLKGLKIDPASPLQMDFILDSAEASIVTKEDLKNESFRLIKYFLAALAVPEKDMWVNLSPYERDRIIPDEFGRTEMGRDLLNQDYLLKKVTASLLYPENEIGREFWEKVYALAVEKYGTSDIPINALNKVWIIPEKAVVYENAEAGTAYIVESELKILLEADYEAARRFGSESSQPYVMNTTDKQSCLADLNTSELSKQVIREIIIPVLQKEVNEGKNFAPLRQVYHSLILAAWYKRAVKQSLLSAVYVNRKKIGGIAINDPLESEKIWSRYMAAFQSGAYNLIREEQDIVTGEIVPRKYFSGGVNFNVDQAMRVTTEISLIKSISDQGLVIIPTRFEIASGDKIIIPPSSVVDRVNTGAFDPVILRESLQRPIYGGFQRGVAGADARQLNVVGETDQRADPWFSESGIDVIRKDWGYLSSTIEGMIAALPSYAPRRRALGHLSRMVDCVRDSIKAGFSHEDMKALEDLKNVFRRGLMEAGQTVEWWEDILRVVTRIIIHRSRMRVKEEFSQESGLYTIARQEKAIMPFDKLLEDMLRQIHEIKDEASVSKAKWVDSTNEDIRKMAAGFHAWTAHVQIGEDDADAQKKWFISWFKPYLAHMAREISEDDRYKGLFSVADVDAVIQALGFGDTTATEMDEQLMSKWKTVLTVMEYLFYPEHYTRMPVPIRNLLWTALLLGYEKAKTLADVNKADGVHVSELIADHMLKVRARDLEYVLTPYQRACALEILVLAGSKALNAKQRKIIVENIALYMDEGLPVGRALINQAELLGDDTGFHVNKWENASIVSLSPAQQDELRLEMLPNTGAITEVLYPKEQYAVGFEVEMKLKGGRDLDYVIAIVQCFLPRGWSVGTAGGGQMEIRTSSTSAGQEGLYENTAEGWARLENDFKSVFSGLLDPYVAGITSVHVNTPVSPLDTTEKMDGYLRLVLAWEGVLFRLTRIPEIVKSDDMQNVFLLPRMWMFSTQNMNRFMVNLLKGKNEGRYQLAPVYANGSRINMNLLRSYVHVQFAMTRYAAEHPQQLDALHLPIPILLGDSPDKGYDRIVSMLADRVFDGDSVGKAIFLKLYNHPIYGHWRKHKGVDPDYQRVYFENGFGRIYDMHRMAGGFEPNPLDLLKNIFGVEDLDMVKLNYWELAREIYVKGTDEEKSEVSTLFADRGFKWALGSDAVQLPEEEGKLFNALAREARHIWPQDDFKGDDLQMIGRHRAIWMNLPWVWNNLTDIEILKALISGFKDPARDIPLLLSMDLAVFPELVDYLLLKGYSAACAAVMDKVLILDRKERIMRALKPADIELPAVLTVLRKLLFSKEEAGYLRRQAFDILSREEKLGNEDIKLLADDKNGEVIEAVVQWLLDSPQYRIEGLELAVKKHPDMDQRKRAVAQRMFLPNGHDFLITFAKEALRQMKDGPDLMVAASILANEQSLTEYIATALSSGPSSGAFLMALVQELKKKGRSDEDIRGLSRESARLIPDYVMNGGVTRIEPVVASMGGFREFFVSAHGWGIILYRNGYVLVHPDDRREYVRADRYQERLSFGDGNLAVCFRDKIMILNKYGAIVQQLAGRNIEFMYLLGGGGFVLVASDNVLVVNKEGAIVQDIAVSRYRKKYDLEGGASVLIFGEKVIVINRDDIIQEITMQVRPLAFSSRYVVLSGRDSILVVNKDGIVQEMLEKGFCEYNSFADRGFELAQPSKRIIYDRDGVFVREIVLKGISKLYLLGGGGSVIAYRNMTGLTPVKLFWTRLRETGFSWKRMLTFVRFLFIDMAGSKTNRIIVLNQKNQIIQKISETRFVERFHPLGGGGAVVEVNGKFIVFNADGDIIYEVEKPGFRDYFICNGGIALIFDREFLFLNQQGKIVLNAAFRECSLATIQDNMVIMQFDDTTIIWDGNTLVRKVASEAHPEGVDVVSKNACAVRFWKKSIVFFGNDTVGQEVEGRFYQAYSVANGIVALRAKDRLVVMNKDGIVSDVLIPGVFFYKTIDGKEFVEGLLYDELSIIIDQKGTVSMLPSFALDENLWILSGPAGRFFIHRDKIVRVTQSSPVVDAAELIQPDTGGIDLHAVHKSFRVKGKSNIKFYLDPVMFERYINASGLTPVILGVYPMHNVQRFLRG